MPPGQGKPSHDHEREAAEQEIGGAPAARVRRDDCAVAEPRKQRHRLERIEVPAVAALTDHADHEPGGEQRPGDDDRPPGQGLERLQGRQAKPEDVRRLFRETFFQADTSSTRKHEGTGLGLVISHKLCKLMGGDIDVQSTLGVGTTFTAHLPTIVIPNLPLTGSGTLSPPIGEPTAPPKSSAETPTVPWQACTVVVIDEEPASRAVLERVLKKEGYVVRTAEPGPDAVALVRELQPSAAHCRMVGGMLARR